MSATITLTVEQGELAGKQYVFDRRLLCTVGRSADCYLQLPGGPLNIDVSRHHCLFDIDPPRVRIRDCGSRNGTFVNGVLIGRREKAQAADGIEPLEWVDSELKDGDEIRLGGTVFRVGITVPALCAGCGCDIAGGRVTGGEREADRLLCDWCRTEAEQAQGKHVACSV